MMRRVLVIALVATMTLLVISPAASATTPVVSSMTTAKLKAAGISLTYPRAWTALPFTKKRLAETLKLVGKRNPELAATLTGVDVSQFELYALDTSGTSPVSSNIVVTTPPGDLGGLSLAEFKDQVAQSYKTLGATIRDAKLTKVDGKRAFRVDASFSAQNAVGASVVESQGALIIPRGSSNTIVAVTSADDAAGAALINELLAKVHRL
jgi:hypothetical protein